MTTRTCDCPIAFPESVELCSQVHRYDCPNAPKKGMRGIEESEPGELYWLVVRIYRGKKRVVSLHSELLEAERSYLSTAENLRDGDVVLLGGTLNKLCSQSGGIQPDAMVTR